MDDPYRLYACKSCHYLNNKLGKCECCGKDVEEQVQYTGIIGLCRIAEESYNLACLKNILEDVSNDLELIPGLYAINIQDDEQEQD